MFDEAFKSQPLSYWEERFAVHDVWWAPAQTMAEVLEDPQIHAAGAFVQVDDGDGRPSGPSTGPSRSGATRCAPPGPPRIGEHTEEVLAEVGLSGAAAPGTPAGAAAGATG